MILTKHDQDIFYRELEKQAGGLFTDDAMYELFCELVEEPCKNTESVYVNVSAICSQYEEGEPEAIASIYDIDISHFEGKYQVIAEVLSVLRENTSFSFETTNNTILYKIF